MTCRYREEEVQEKTLTEGRRRVFAAGVVPRIPPERVASTRLPIPEEEPPGDRMGATELHYHR